MNLPGGKGLLGNIVLKGHGRPAASTESEVVSVSEAVTGTAVVVSTEELLKMQAAWDEVDCMLQGILANNIESAWSVYIRSMKQRMRSIRALLPL